MNERESHIWVFHGFPFTGVPRKIVVLETSILINEVGLPGFLHELDASLFDLLVHFYMNCILRCLISLAFLHELDAPSLGLLLHFYKNLRWPDYTLLAVWLKKSVIDPVFDLTCALCA